ncbi:toxin-antitoxin system YwqK family antitoxin [Pedobacter caeni]|uniref:MORN repeat variant n=1 Tax=Pedobacter caeni TaxID=288992 RepID=A0A1M4WIX5_9SPHI|nr:hypothetical protein [Pedobacter caeni]SHE81176.1 hypothetical protein SAMN04488522_1011282 [Pedobacter caeni]
MIRVDFDDDDLQYKSIDAGGGNMYDYRGLPFTGTIVEFHNNGNLIGETECKNGYTNGWQRLYYSTGQIEREYYVECNRNYKSYKCWDEVGKLQMHIEYDENGNEISKLIYR